MHVIYFHGRSWLAWSRCVFRRSSKPPDRYHLIPLIDFLQISALFSSILFSSEYLFQFSPFHFFFFSPYLFLLSVVLETKTLDNVFVTVHVSVQYQVIREKVYSAYYVLSDLQAQMRAVRQIHSTFICIAITLFSPSLSSFSDAVPVCI